MKPQLNYWLVAGYTVKWMAVFAWKAWCVVATVIVLCLLSKKLFDDKQE